MDAETVTTWGKRIGVAVTVLGLIWAGFRYLNRLDRAVDIAHENRQALQRIETAQALTYCELREIPPADCEIPEATP